MELRNDPFTTTSNPKPKVTEEDLLTLRDVCRAEMSKGGLRGEIAAEILEISERMRALSVEIEETLGKTPSIA